MKRSFVRILASLFCILHMNQHALPHSLSHCIKGIVKLYTAIPKPLVLPTISFTIPSSYWIAQWHIAGKKVYSFDNAQEASEPVTHYTRAQLASFGVENAQNIRVMIYPPIIFAAGFNYMLLMGDRQHECIEQLIENPHSSQASYLYTSHLTRAILAHEAHHLKQNDTVRRFHDAFALGVGTIPVYRILCRAASESIKHKLHHSWLLGITFNITAHALCRTQSRIRERLADEAIPNDPALLQAMCEFMMVLSDEESVLEKVFATHPSSQDRAERFKQRLEEINQNQSHP